MNLPPPLVESSRTEFAEVGDYEFACTQGQQANDFFWMTTFTFGQAKDLLTPFLEREKIDTRNPLSIVQRTLNQGRAQKIAKYVIRGLVPGNFYVMPPIVVTIALPIDCSIGFDAIQLDDDDNQFNGLGILRVPSFAVFGIPDGQHRALAAALALTQAPALTQKESVGIMLVPDDLAGRKHKQIFLDCNQHAVKPSKSIIALFAQDSASEVAREILLTVPIFEGRTALEATNIAPNSDDLFTLNAIQEATKRLLKKYDPQLAIAFWRKVAEYHPHWKEAQICDSVSELRRASIAFNALTLNALAITAEKMDEFDWVERLDQINWSINNPDWEGICRFNGGNIIKNSDTMNNMAIYFKNRIDTSSP